MSDTAARVVEPNHRPGTFPTGRNGQLFAVPPRHRALTIFRQVQEDLHQALAISPYRGQIVFQFPTAAHSIIAQARLNDDSEFVKQCPYFNPTRVAR